MRSKSSVKSRKGKWVHDEKDYIWLDWNSIQWFDCWESIWQENMHEHWQISYLFISKKNEFTSIHLSKVREIIKDGFAKISDQLDVKCEPKVDFLQKNIDRPFSYYFTEIFELFHQNLECIKSRIIIKTIFIFELAKMFRVYIKKWAKKVTEIQSKNSFDTTFERFFYVKEKKITPKSGTLLSTISHIKSILYHFL